MSSLKISSILAFALATVMITMAVFALPGVTYYVDDDFTIATPGWGITNFSNITDAINAASAGYTIDVAAGTYNENVIVNKSVNLVGAGSAVVNIVAANSAVKTVLVESNNVNISGFTISGATGAGQAGIFINPNVNGCNIEDNVLTNNFDGIWLGAGSGYNTISNNNLTANYQGFEIYISDHNTFTNNNASVNNNYGFKIDSGQYNTYINNIANNNVKYGFYVVTGAGGGANNTVFESNTANLNTQYGIRINGGNNTTLSGNTFDSNSLAGMRLKDGIVDLNLTGNLITNNPTGIDIDVSVYDNITTWIVEGNDISGNTNYNILSIAAYTLDASNNWWGSPLWTVINSTISGDVNFVPYYTDAEMTTLDDGMRPVINFNWWNTKQYDMETGIESNITLPDSRNFTTSSDIFYSPTDNILNISVNVTDNTDVEYVEVDLTEFDSFTTVSLGTCGGIVNLTNVSADKWEYNCSLGNFNIADIMDYTGGQPVASFNAIFTAYDSYGNPSAGVYNTTVNPPQEANYSDPICMDRDANVCMPALAIVNVQDFGVPEGDDECMEMGALTTNFSDMSQVPDFNAVNFILQADVNLSCWSENPAASTDFNTMVLFNFSSLDFSSPAMGTKMSMLASAIDITILPPNTFGESRIYVNTSFFEELDSNTTITLYHLPFMTQPNITTDLGAAGIDLSSIVWTTPALDPLFNDSYAGNLTFTVYGFSGYNILDNVAPTVQIITPVNETLQRSSSVNISVIVNGTGTEPSNITGMIGSTSAFSYDHAAIRANCTNLTENREVVECNMTITTTDGIKTLNVTAYDYGESAPGNSASNTSVFTIDTTAPTITYESVSNITNTTAYFNVTTDENSNCRIKYGVNESSLTTVNMTSITRGKGDYNTIMGSSTISNSTEHNATLSGLAVSTEYYYKINCTDVAGNNMEGNISDFYTANSQTEDFDNTTDVAVGFNSTTNGTSTQFLNLTINTNETVNGATVTATLITENPTNDTLSNAAGIYVSIESDQLNELNLESVEIRVYYNEQDIIDAGLVEANLRLYYYNNATGAWEQVPGGVDTVNNYVFGTVNHFSFYGIGAITPSTPSTGGATMATGGVNVTYVAPEEEGTQPEVPNESVVTPAVPGIDMLPIIVLGLVTLFIAGYLVMSPVKSNPEHHIKREVHKKKK